MCHYVDSHFLQMVKLSVFSFLYKMFAIVSNFSENVYVILMNSEEINVLKLLNQNTE